MATFRGLFVRKDSTRGVQPAEARLAMAGLLARSDDVAARSGILSGLVVSGIASTWAYAVSGGHAVTVRSSTDGVNLPGLDGSTNTPTTADNTGASLAAPASGSRWDLIWIRQRDVDNADADSESALGVTSGNASGSPSKPYASVPAGALVLAEAQVSAGATGTLHANVVITQVAPRTTTRGGIVKVGNAAALALLPAGSAADPVYADQADTQTLWRNAGSGWVEVASRRGRSRVTRSSLQSIPNAAVTSIVWDAQDAHAAPSMWTSGANVTVPWDGWWTVSANITFDVNANGIRLGYIVAGGTRIAEELMTSAGAGGPTTLSMTASVWLPAGTALALNVYQTSGAALNIITSEVIPDLNIVSA